jgi:hypothetical protein
MEFNSGFKGLNTSEVSFMVQTHRFLT